MLNTTISITKFKLLESLPNMIFRTPFDSQEKGDFEFYGTPCVYILSKYCECTFLLMVFLKPKLKGNYFYDWIVSRRLILSDNMMQVFMYVLIRISL